MSHQMYLVKYSIKHQHCYTKRCIYLEAAASPLGVLRSWHTANNMCIKYSSSQHAARRRFLAFTYEILR